MDDEPIERDGEVLVPVLTEHFGADDWPYRDHPPRSLAGSGARLVPLTPYHRWASRGPGTTRVWLRVDGM